MKGVTFDRATGKWLARITYNGVRRNLGRFNTREDAEFKLIRERRRLEELSKYTIDDFKMKYEQTDQNLIQRMIARLRKK